MRTRDLLAVSAATLALLVGVVALPVQHTPTRVAPALSARLTSATQVTHSSDGKGYWLVAADGHVWAFGGAHLYGSMAGKPLTAPITGIVATPDNRGYWLVARDGGVFSFGDATFAGSLGRRTLVAPVVGMASSPGSSEVQAPSGPAGSNGANGTTGENGAAGAIGPTGAAGPTGPPGAVNTGAYAYVYNTSLQYVAMDTAVNFDSNGLMSGFEHAPGNPGILTLAAGTYRVDFAETVIQPNQFALFVNGVIVDGSTFGSDALNQQNNGEIILTLAVNDVLTVVNHTTIGTAILETNAGGSQQNVSASIVIQQIA